MNKRLVWAVLLLSSTCLFASSITLADLESSMMSSNTDIRKANETVTQAYLDVKDAKANFQPSISLSGTATYMVNPPIGRITLESSDVLSQMGLGSYAGMATGYVTLYDGMENTLYMGTLSLTEPLITWGKLEKAVDLYSSVYAAQSFRRDDTVRQNQAELRVRVWSLKYIEEMRSLLEEAQSLANELVDLSDSAYQNGMMLRQDYLNVQISSMEVEVKMAELETKADEVLSGLETFVNRRDFSILDVEVPEEDWSRYQDEELSMLCALATGNSSDNIAAARSLVDVYNTQVDIAKRSMYGIPDFALQLSLTYGGSRAPFVEMGFRQKDTYGLNLSVGFSTTLWDGGKILNNLSRAESNVRDAQATLDSTKSQLEDAVRSNYKAMVYAIKDIEYLLLKVENLENELELIRTNMEYGQKSRSDEIQKMLEILTVEGEILAERIQVAQNVFTLDYLTGVDF